MPSGNATAIFLVLSTTSLGVINLNVIKVLIERGSLKVTFEVFQYLFYGVLEKENIIVWSVKTGIHDKQESCYVRKEST